MPGSQQEVDHVDICESCGAEIAVYSEKKHRHCAVCRRDDWLRKQGESRSERASVEPDPPDTLEAERRGSGADDGVSEGDGIRGEYQRARSRAEKGDRRLKILAAAEAQIVEGGLDGFTMGTLASRAGIAKGTLYLYFETKDVVLMELVQHRLAGWVSALVETVREGMTDAAFCGLFWDSIETDLVLNLTLLDVALRPDTPEEWVGEFLARQNSIFTPLARQLEHCLHLPRGAGGRVITYLWALLAGLVQRDITRMRPGLSATDFPSNAVWLYRMLDSKALFVRAAPALIANERSER
jgi:AcrR family transcriptional regulator